MRGWDPAGAITAAVNAAPDPFTEAEALLAAVREAKASGSLDAFELNPRWEKLRESWAPDSIEKLAAWATILAVVLTLLRSAPETKIEINQTFHQQCEEAIDDPERFGIEDLIPPDLRRL
jgi:hypothetical protein